MPKVSIVIPTYQRAHLLNKVIRNVFAQTFTDFELIIVDDYSSDNTEDIVSQFNDPRLKFIRHTENRGAPAARNTGILASKGKYVAFQDSDDEWEPQKIEKQVELFLNSPEEIGVVYTAFYRIDNDRKEYIPYTWVQEKQGNIFKELLKGSFITTPAMMVRKECFLEVGMFDERLPRLQDWDLAIRLAKKYRFGFIKDPLLKSYNTPGNISSSKSARVKALRIILDKNLEEFKLEPKLLARYYYSIAEFLCTNGEIDEGKKYLERALSYNNSKREYSNRSFIIGRRIWLRNLPDDGKKMLWKAYRYNPRNLLIPITFIVLQYCVGIVRKIKQK